jgi:hypothetical protein
MNLSCPANRWQDVNKTITLSAEDEMVIKSQLKMSTAALNNTSDQNRDTRLTSPTLLNYFSRSLEMVGPSERNAL